MAATSAGCSRRERSARPQQEVAVQLETVGCHLVTANCLRQCVSARLHWLVGIPLGLLVFILYHGRGDMSGGCRLGNVRRAATEVIVTRPHHGSRISHERCMVCLFFRMIGNQTQKRLGFAIVGGTIVPR